MRHVSTRINSWLSLGILIAGLVVMSAGTTAAQESKDLQALPIYVLNCDRDPGNINPGGGRGGDPDARNREFGCAPAKGVAVTIYNLDVNFHARCDTDAKGLCEVMAPPDPTRELMVAVHTATVVPGFEPIEALGTTFHYTEFTGVGIVNLRTQVLAVNVASCPAQESADDCARTPIGNELAQVSPGDITSRNAPWLATNDDGWVSFDIGQMQSDTIDLMFASEDQPRITCTDLDSGTRLDATWLDEREGTFFRITPTSAGDINCDVTFTEPE
jgi:hypothetical protein